MNDEKKDVSLTIGKDIVTPIIQAKVNDIVLEALGGKDDLVNRVINVIINQKVNSEGKVSSYSSENKYNYLEVVLTNQIKEAIKDELKNQIVSSSSEIKKCLIDKLKTNKGANLVAKALLDGLGGTFKSSWTSNIEISLKNKD